MEKQGLILITAGVIPEGGDTTVDMACSGCSLDHLLIHYASHHHVLEKLMMYESELNARQLRYVGVGAYIDT
jgi:hypothetical protein